MYSIFNIINIACPYFIVVLHIPMCNMLIRYKLSLQNCAALHRYPWSWVFMGSICSSLFIENVGTMGMNTLTSKQLLPEFCHLIYSYFKNDCMAKFRGQ